MNVIKLKHGEVGKLAKAFKVNPRTVRNALCGESNSSLARMLRKAALERGASAYVHPDYVSTCETEFRTSEKQMIQTFGERVRIVIDLTTGDANLYADGELQSTYHNLTMKEIVNVQVEAQRIADELSFNIKTK